VEYYLSADTAGGIVSTPPSGTGKIVQPVGVAISATALLYERQRFVKLA
jgi:hypothetical protein